MDDIVPIIVVQQLKIEIRTIFIVNGNTGKKVLQFSYLFDLALFRRNFVLLRKKFILSTASIYVDVYPI